MDRSASSGQEEAVDYIQIRREGVECLGGRRVAKRTPMSRRASSD